MASRSTVILAVSIASTGLVMLGLLYPSREVDDSLQQEVLASLQADHDYHITGMVLDRFSPDGFHNFRLTADRVTHFPARSISILEMPALQWFDPETRPWTISANNGVFYPGETAPTDRLELHDEVHARTTTTRNLPLTISSASLQVFPGLKEINTEDSVTLTTGNSRLSGLGMQGWLPEHRIKLQSGAGIYE